MTYAPGIRSFTEFWEEPRVMISLSIGLLIVDGEDVLGGTLESYGDVQTASVDLADGSLLLLPASDWECFSIYIEAANWRSGKQMVGP